MNTYLVFQRFQLTRWPLNKTTYETEVKVTRKFMKTGANAAHSNAFAEASKQKRLIKS